jgi:hypothetical protein
MPRLTLVCLILAAITWLVGGNILVAIHYRRLGKSAWSGFRPFVLHFKTFNEKEWIVLGILLVIALGIGGVGLLFLGL